MANEEHVAILKQGVDVWNRWRTKNPDIEEPNFQQADLAKANLRRVNLGGANLQGANLRGADLRGAHFTWADLQGAYLTKANLEGTDLREVHFGSADFTRARLFDADLTRAGLRRSHLTEADFTRARLYGAHLTEANFMRAQLYEADLQEADLFDANLTRANLRGANLSRSHLRGANLQGARLKRANLTNAEVGYTSFDDLDLRDVQGLEKVKHTAPSTIGIDTLYRSQGQIPEVFLRGCGVPDSMIEYARALVAAERPIDYYSCFISYSSQDETLAEQLYVDLQAEGVRCWYAPHDLPIGEPILSGIDQAIRFHDKVLLLLSSASVESGWVEKEVQMAIAREATERRRVLFPIRIDDTVLKGRPGWPTTIWDTINIGDFRQWKAHDSYQEAFQRLLRDLKAEQR